MEFRLATSDDGAEVAGIYAPFVLDTAVSFETEPPDAAEMGRRIFEAWPRHPWLVAVVDGRVRAYAYAAPHRARAAYRWAVDVSVYVSRDVQRRGLGRELYRRLFRLLHVQGYHTAHAGIALPNPASVAFHESFGFQPVGVFPEVGWKLGGWHDVGWWRLRLVDPASPPGEILGLDRIGDLPPNLR